MRLRKQLWLAAVYLVVVLAIAPSQPETAGLLIFLGVVTPAMLWLLGITRTPGFVRAARKAARARGALPARSRPPLAPAEFRYPRKRAAQVVLYALALFMAGMCAFVLIAMGPKGWPVVLILGCSVVLHAWIAYRTPRIVLRVAPAGLESVELFGTYRMAWDDVVVLAGSDFYAYGGRLSGQTHVYSQHERIAIGEQLLGYQELLAIIRAQVPPVVLQPPQAPAVPTRS